jgi:signal transduction histidine kinase
MTSNGAPDPQTTFAVEAESKSRVSPLKKSSWYRIAMAAAMVIVLVNSWLAVRALRSLFVVQGWRAHTLEVLTHTRNLEFQVSQGNSNVRAYLLTGSPIFVQRYHEARSAIDAEVAEVQRLTGDNPSQQERIVFLRKRIIAKRAALDAGIALRSGASGPLDESVLHPILLDSPDSGPSVSYCISQLESEEQRLLTQRTRETSHAETEVWLSFIGASLLDIILLAAAAELLIRIGRDRESIAESAAEIDSLNAELQIVNAELETRVDERTRELALSNQELEAFSYSVSHDLRAPLRTIDGFSLALQEDFADRLNDEGRDYITRVRSGVQRMGTLIDALLQLSRVTRSDLQTETVNLSQLSTLVFNELQASDPERHVTFLAQPDVLVQGDPRLLRIALENLIGNAWKFTSKRDEAKIEFATGMREGRPVYFIRDNGAGFDMQYVDRLFTAFQRLHGDRDFKGSGIGLATVSRIIRRHHGSIGAESEPGQGATFYFHLAS